MEALFFELLRVAIGNQSNLSSLPDKDGWDELYELAQKQSLVGVCFVALQNIGADADEGYSHIGMTEIQYLTWMGMAAMIQQNNEQMNSRCVELQKMLSKKGFRSCIIKGQANYPCYGELAPMRQSGDIDVWIEGGREKVIELVDSICPTREIRETHARLTVFDDAEVEAHYRPGLVRDFIRNKRLQEYFNQMAEECFTHTLLLPCGEIVAPTVRFNAVQQLMHIYHHLFDSGIGLRQILDYYYVLLNLSPEDKAGVMSTVKSVGVERFAHALMYVEKTVFAIDDKYLFCEPCEKDGEYLLGEIMAAGNFGHYDSRRKHHTSHSFFHSFFDVYFKNLNHLRFAPMEWLWSPLWRLYYFAWRKWRGYD